MRRGGGGGFGGDRYVSSRLFARALDSSSSLSCGRLRVFLALSKDSELFPLKGECLGGSCLRAPVNSRSLSPVSPVGNGVRLFHDWKTGPFFFVNAGGFDCAATSPCSVPTPRILLVPFVPSAPPQPWVTYDADDGLERGNALRVSIST